jgi:hypothetical protein
MLRVAQRFLVGGMHTAAVQAAWMADASGDLDGSRSEVSCAKYSEIVTQPDQQKRQCEFWTAKLLRAHFYLGGQARRPRNAAANPIP